MKIAAIIPAHLASVRFPRKALFRFHGLPMIEHVRRRALLLRKDLEVYVATSDEEIADTVCGFGGRVILTGADHTNGTSRAAEAVQEIECTHVLLLQGDEPLLLPRHLAACVEAIAATPNHHAWNATGPIEHEDELDRHSFVKCAISSAGRILYCFRRSPCYAPFEAQKSFIRKILGIIAYRKDFLLRFATLAPSPIEQTELIEQMRIIENGYSLWSIPVSPSLPSVNEPWEADVVLDYLEGSAEQRALLKRISA